jgi:hypothetical protein
LTQETSGSKFTSAKNFTLFSFFALKFKEGRKPNFSSAAVAKILSFMGKQRGGGAWEVAVQALTIFPIFGSTKT